MARLLSMNRKSKRLKERSEKESDGDKVANDTVFVDIGGNDVVVSESSEAIPVDIDLSDGLVTVVAASTAAAPASDDVVLAELVPGVDVPVIERGGYDVVGNADTVVEVAGDEGSSSSSRGRDRDRNKSAYARAREDMAEKLEVAMEQFRTGAWKSVRACAKFYGVCHSTLNNMLKDPEVTYKERGCVSKVLSEEEEKSIVDFIIWRMQHGCGLEIFQVRFYSLF